jgi:hypothetical protein
MHVSNAMLLLFFSCMSALPLLKWPMMRALFRCICCCIYNSFFERVSMVQQHERLTQQERSAALKAEERALAALLKVTQNIAHN